MTYYRSRSTRAFCYVLGLITAPLVVVTVSADVTFADSAWVQVRESVIRAKPAFFAPSVAPVKYGDALSRISEEGGWAKVGFRGKEGFLPLSTVTPARIVLSGKSSGKVVADASDVVLAGKGFSKEVEEQYKRSGGGMRYDLVDRVERQCRVNPSEVKAFAAQGGLNG